MFFSQMPFNIWVEIGGGPARRFDHKAQPAAEINELPTAHNFQGWEYCSRRRGATSNARNQTRNGQLMQSPSLLGFPSSVSSKQLVTGQRRRRRRGSSSNSANCLPGIVQWIHTGHCCPLSNSSSRS